MHKQTYNGSEETIVMSTPVVVKDKALVILIKVRADNDSDI